MVQINSFFHIKSLQGKGDGSYNNGGSYRHQDEGEGSGGEEDKKANQGESLSLARVFRFLQHLKG